MEYLDKLISDLKLIRKKYDNEEMTISVITDEKDNIIGVFLGDYDNAIEFKIDKKVDSIYVVFNKDNNKIEGVDINEINNELFYSKKYKINNISENYVY